MKQLLLGIFMFTTSILTFGEYNYPFHNPNIATIFGSSTLMSEGVSETIPIKEYKIKLPWSKPVIENFWYNEGFKFSLVPQKQKAPLVFLLAGTGSAHNSIRMNIFQRILFDAGYHVISISSPMNSNFLINASKSQMPGVIFEDSKDIYDVMKETYRKVKNSIEVSDFYVVGYSLGATEAGMVSYIDEQEKSFNFKRIFMINPAVNAYTSALKLDNYLDFPENERAQKIQQMIEKVIAMITSNPNPEYTALNAENIYKLFSQKQMSDSDMKKLIGMAFRLTAIDLNYIADVLGDRKVYSTQIPKKFTPMFETFKKVNFATFGEYIDRLAFPYYKEKLGPDTKLEDVLEKSKLEYIQEYLKTASKIAVVTNADELILNEADFNFLKSTFGERIIIYPFGGHCGNMFFSTNIDIMLKFLKEGELKHEV